MHKKNDDALAKAIAKTCSARDIRIAVGARPEFQVESEMPDDMLDLLARLAESSGRKP